MTPQNRVAHPKAQHPNKKTKGVNVFEGYPKNGGFPLSFPLNLAKKGVTNSKKSTPQTPKTFDKRRSVRRNHIEAEPFSLDRREKWCPKPPRFLQRSWLVNLLWPPSFGLGFYWDLERETTPSVLLCVGRGPIRNTHPGRPFYGDHGTAK